MAESTKNHNTYIILGAKEGEQDHFQTGRGHIVSMDYDARTTVRNPYNRTNYEEHRPTDVLPTTDRDIMKACRQSYEKVGIIRSVIDLQVEMAIEGLNLVCDHLPTENFWKNWAKRVSLEDRCEKFGNYFLVEGNTVVRRIMGKIDSAEVRRMRLDAYTAYNQIPEIEPGLIPVEYLFYNPSNMAVVGDELSSYSSNKTYGIRISSTLMTRLVTIIKRLQQERPSALKGVPEEFIRYANNPSLLQSTVAGDFIMPIVSNRLYVAHSKKSDSDVWAKSPIYSILHDVLYNEKLRVAKISTLDDWCNAVKIWKLGDHTAQILPTDEQLTDFANMLENKAGGTFEIAWDSLIAYEAHYPPIEQLQTFEENHESILIGLGVHRSLIGGSETSGNNAASAFVGLRNMMKRVDAVRRAIKTWLEVEIDIVSQNLGFQNKPQVKFSQNNLFDQQSYFKLMIDLLDRGILSDKTLLEKIGELPDIESSRVKEETKAREAGELPEKKGQFIQPEIPESNKETTKELTTHSGNVDIKTGLALPKPKVAGPAAKKKPPKTKGRPSGSKDGKKRNRKYKAKSEAMIAANKIQDKLDAIIDPQYLVYKKVDSKRKLSAEDRNMLENSKFNILAACSDIKQLESDQIESILDSADTEDIEYFNEYFESLVKDANNPDMTYSERKMLASIAYSEIYTDAEDYN